MYNLLRPALFALSPETSHELALDGLGACHRLGLTRLLPVTPLAGPRRTLWGLTFSNPVGLAAGLDKNADCLDALGRLGFGFIEVGTVTPRPQAGNPAPRLFRLADSQAIINRMGFNNKGVDYLVERLKRSRYPGVVGVNIGKNRDTAEDRALDDYLYCLERAYPHAGYLVVNLSSPNTPGLRELQFGEAFRRLLDGLKRRQAELAAEHGWRPLLIKVAPDLEAADIEALATSLNEFEVDGLVVGNTSVDHSAVADQPHAEEAGGLSGQPLFEHASRVLTAFRQQLRPGTPLIGTGGICQGEDARAKMAAGADLVQVYTGLIYRGPRLVGECLEALKEAEGSN